MKAFCGSFSNPTWIACVYLDFRKLYIVMTKLAKMKVTSVELAMWDLLHMPRTIQKPMLENGITSFPKIFFFCVPQKQNSEWSGRLAASRDLMRIKDGYYEGIHISLWLSFSECWLVFEDCVSVDMNFFVSTFLH